MHGGRTSPERAPNGGAYVEPAIVEMPGQTAIVREETFAPILYMLGYETLEEAIAIHNGVPQGLSSCIFTLDLREAEAFLSAAGSDCGIANVNIGPSAPRSAAPSAARRRPAAAARAAPTPGRTTCAGRPAR